MIRLHEEYLIDEKGRKKRVLLPYNEWKKVLEDLEELEDIRAYDKAKSRSSDPIPFDIAVKEIKQG